jgi:hypothetical protein
MGRRKSQPSPSLRRIAEEAFAQIFREGFWAEMVKDQKENGPIGQPSSQPRGKKRQVAQQVPEPHKNSESANDA